MTPVARSFRIRWCRRWRFRVAVASSRRQSAKGRLIESGRRLEATATKEFRWQTKRGRDVSISAKIPQAAISGESTTPPMTGQGRVISKRIAGDRTAKPSNSILRKHGRSPGQRTMQANSIRMSSPASCPPRNCSETITLNSRNQFQGTMGATRTLARSPAIRTASSLHTVKSLAASLPA